MFWDIVFWASLLAAIAIGGLFFRDLGDVSQMFFKVKREDMLRAIRNEPRTLKLGMGLAAIMIASHLLFDGGSPWAFWVGLAFTALFFGFPFIWLHIALRNQQGIARFYSIEEARKFTNPEVEGILTAY